MVALNHNVHFWNEIKNAGIVVVLLVAYLFLMVPYVIRVKVDQIVQVSEVDLAQGRRSWVGRMVTCTPTFLLALY